MRFPTGGKQQASCPASPRALPAWLEGQQIRCDSEADGIVRMKEIGCAAPVMGRLQPPYALADRLSILEAFVNQHINKPSGAAAPRVAFIQSDWHRDIVNCSRQGFVERLTEAGLSEANVDFFVVPGAFEIPLKAKRLAATGNYAAIVAAGLVVDGGIYRHEFVAEAVISGLMRVQLDTDVPVLSAVLTPHHFHDHGVHQTFFAEHFVEKGREVANVCLAIVDPAYAVA